MVEVVLAATLTWLSPTGVGHTQTVNGTFRDLGSCSAHLSSEMDRATRITGTTPILTGRLCEERTVQAPPAPPPYDPRREKALNDLRKALNSD